MNSRKIALVAMCVALPLIAAADEGKKAVRELELKAEVFAAGSVEKPLVIATVAEFAAAFPDSAVRERLAKDVNFASEQLLLFTWSGSGADKLTHAHKVLCSKSREAEAIFRYTPGGGSDRKTHAHLFVMPSDKRTKWRVEVATGR